MTELRNTIEIAATPEAVWGVLGELSRTADWVPGTVAARVDDGIRICETADGNEIHEEITDYSAERRTYRYRHLRVPLPVESSAGTFTVEEATNGGARVVLESSFEALDPGAAAELERMLDAGLDEALRSLRRLVEDDVPWRAA